MEPHPPRVPEPYSIVRETKYGKTTWWLKKDGDFIKPLSPYTEDGAHREAMIYLKSLDF
jgi:hypothetical protein